MKARWLVYLPGILAACAATDPVHDGADEGGRPGVSDHPDATTSGDDGDALAGEADAGACNDCEYFPEACTPDVLCYSGLFEPEPSGAGLDPRITITVVRGRSSKDVWAAGSAGALAHFDGASWSVVNLGIKETMRGLWLRDSSEVSFLGFQRLYARGSDAPDGGAGAPDGAWTLYAPSYAAGVWAPYAFSSAWAARDAEWMWCGAEGSSGLWRLRQAPSRPFEGEFGITPETCESVGCAMVSSIHGWSANDLWAVGSLGATVRISGAQSDAPSATTYNSQTRNALRGVWAASATEAWAVGAAGTIRRYTGDSLLWEIVTNTQTAVKLNAIWGSSSTDVWAVGDESVVLHFDGTSWSRVKIAGLGGLRPNLGTVWASEPGHVWIGGEGVLLSLGGRS